MRSATSGSLAPSSDVRKVRRLLADLMEQADDAREVPAICARIRKAREAITDPKTGETLAQEEVARRISAVATNKRDRISARAYGDLERWREPTQRRLRQIAVALELPEDYFMPSADVAQATAKLEAEVDRLHGLGDGLEELLALLRSQTAATPPVQPRHEQK